MLLLIGVFAPAAVDAENYGAIAGCLIGMLFVILMLGYASARIAERAGGNTWAFFALGAILPVLGLLAAAIYYTLRRKRPGGETASSASAATPGYYQPNYLQAVRPVPTVEPVPTHEARQRAPRSRFNSCASCGADNPSSMTSCWKCGKSLADGLNRRVCPQCGAHVLSTAEFCTDCGARLVDSG